MHHRMSQAPAAKRSAIARLLGCLAGCVLAGVVMFYATGQMTRDEPTPKAPPTAASPVQVPEPTAVDMKSAVRTVTVGEPDAEALYLAAVASLAVGSVTVHFIVRLVLDELTERRVLRRRDAQ